VVGVIKAALSLRHQTIPPVVHFERLNSHIVLDNSPFFVNTKLRRWESPGDEPRRVAVNSFGFGGTNAHVVLEEYFRPAAAAKELAPAVGGGALIVLSARSADRLAVQVRQFLEIMRSGAFADSDLLNVAYTLQAAAMR